jgi:hypothetical protein
VIEGIDPATIAAQASARLATKTITDMRYLLAFLALMLTSPAWAYEDLILPKVDFEATAVHQAGRFQSKEKIYYSGGKLRVERGNGFATVILDLATQTQYLLMANRTYMITPMDDEYFRRFIAVAEVRKLGTDHVDGMKATKYAFGDNGALQAAGTYWLSDNGIMLRRDYNDGVFGTDIHHRDFLTDLKIAPQPARLFGIPSNYRQVK